MRYYEPPQFDVKSLFVPDMTPWEQMIKMKEYEFAVGKDMADKQQKKVDEAGAKIEDAFSKITRTGGARTSEYAQNYINPVIEAERQKAHAELAANPNAANGILFNAISNIKKITNSRGYQNTLLDESYLPEAYKSSIEAKNTPMVHQNYLNENGQFKQLDKNEIESINWNPNLYETYKGQPIQKEFNWIADKLKGEIRKEYGDVELETLYNPQGIPTTYIVKKGGQRISELTRPMIEEKIKPYIEKYNLGDDFYSGYKLRTTPGYNKQNLITELGDYLNLGTYRNTEDIPDEYKALPQGKTGKTGLGNNQTEGGLPNVLGTALDLIKNSPTSKTTVDQVSASAIAGMPSYDTKANAGQIDLSNSRVIYNYVPTTKSAIEESQNVKLKSDIANNYMQIVANDDRIKALMSSALGKDYTVKTSDDGKGLVKVSISNLNSATLSTSKFVTPTTETPITTTEVFKFVNDLLAKPGASKAYPELAQFRLNALANGIDLSNTKDLDELEEWKLNNPGTAKISKAFEEGTFNGNYKISIPRENNIVIDKNGTPYVSASIEIPANQIQEVLFPDNYGPGYNYQDLLKEGHIKEKYDAEGNKYYVSSILIPSATDINTATTTAQMNTFGSDKLNDASIKYFQNENNNKATDIQGDKLLKNIEKNYSLFKPEDKNTIYSAAKNPQVQSLYTNIGFDYNSFVDAVIKSNNASDFATLVLSVNNPQAFLNIINNKKNQQMQSSSGGGATNLGKPQVGVKVR